MKERIDCFTDDKLYIKYIEDALKEAEKYSTKYTTEELTEKIRRELLDKEI